MVSFIGGGNRRTWRTLPTFGSPRQILSYKVTQIAQHHHRNRFQKFSVRIETDYKADVIPTKYTIQSLKNHKN